MTKRQAARMVWVGLHSRKQGSKARILEWVGLNKTDFNIGVNHLFMSGLVMLDDDDADHIEPTCNEFSAKAKRAI